MLLSQPTCTLWVELRKTAQGGKTLNLIRRFLCGVALVGLSLVSAPRAQADSLFLVFDSVTSLGGGIYEWDYHVDLSASSFVDGTSLLTLYDINGFVAGSAAITGGSDGGDWTISEQPLGFDASGQLVADDARMNVTIDKTGGTTPPAGPTTALVRFQFNSTISSIAESAYAAQDRRVGSGSLQGNQGLVEAPDVPEPAFYQMSGLLAGGGLMALRTLRRGRRQK
jgi:hypothetical protein